MDEIILLKKLWEADDEKTYVGPEELNTLQKKLVDELVDIQKHINDVQKRLEAFKTKKGEIDPVIINALEELKADGVLLEKALLYLQKGTAVPSFKKVYDAVEQKLKPAAKKLLEDAYKKLSVERAPALVVKIKNEGVMGTIGAWLRDTFTALVKDVSAGVKEVAGALGIS